MILQQGFGVLW